MRGVYKLNLLLLISAAISSYAHPDARAQTDAMRLSSTTGALIVDRDSTELVFNGQRYALEIRRPKLSESARTETPFLGIGIVYNLRSPIEIVGTYLSAAPADREATTILLQNANGVILRFEIEPGDAEASLSLDGLTIYMQ